jgi:hypothetical protein
VLRIILGPRRSSKRTEELPNKILKLYFTPDKPRMRWVGHVARTGEIREAHTVFVGKSEGTRQLVRARLRYTIKASLK